MGGVTPIYRLLHEEAFEPEVGIVMGEAYEDVLRTLGLVDRTDPLTELVAKKMIELARGGERDPARLKTLTLNAFNWKVS